MNFKKTSLLLLTMLLSVSYVDIRAADSNNTPQTNQEDGKQQDDEGLFERRAPLNVKTFLAERYESSLGDFNGVDPLEAARLFEETRRADALRYRNQLMEQSEQTEKDKLKLMHLEVLRQMPPATLDALTKNRVSLQELPLTVVAAQLQMVDGKRKLAALTDKDFARAEQAPRVENLTHSKNEGNDEERKLEGDGQKNDGENTPPKDNVVKPEEQYPNRFAILGYNALNYRRSLFGFGAITVALHKLSTSTRVPMPARKLVRLVELAAGIATVGSTGYTIYEMARPTKSTLHTYRLTSGYYNADGSTGTGTGSRRGSLSRQNPTPLTPEVPSKTDPIV